MRGFTVPELLVTIAIIGIVSVIATTILNPAELRKQARDSTRLNDLSTINNAAKAAVQNKSMPISSILCANPAIPICFGRSTYLNATALNDGWAKINFNNIQLLGDLVKFTSLPKDPTNSGGYAYVYCSDGNDWELNAILESKKYSSYQKNSKDGGDQEGVYEVGSNLGLIKDSGGVCSYTQPVPPSTLSNGLVAYWKMDDTTPNAIDSVGGHTGIPNGTVAGADGIVNLARTFNSSQDYLNVADSDNLTFSTGMSVGFWLKSASSLVGTSFVSKWAGTGPGVKSEWAVICQSTGLAAQLQKTDNSFIQISTNVDCGTTATSLANDTWHYIVFTWDGGTTPASLKLYKDNVLLTNIPSSGGNFTGMINTNTPVRIGKAFGAFNSFVGTIDAVGIWNRALNATEMTNQWNGGNGVQFP